MKGTVLIHHGIKGQKWGVRRYQNANGTLTAEGMARYKTDSKFAEKYDRQQATKAYDDAKYARASAEYNSALSDKYRKNFNNTNKYSNFEKAENYQTAAYASRADEEVKLKKARKLINDYVLKYQNKKLKNLKFDTSGRASIKNYNEAAKIIFNASSRKPTVLTYLGGAVGGAINGGLTVLDGLAYNKKYVDENTKKYKDRIQELRES